MKSIKKITAIIAMTAVLAMSVLGCGKKLAPADQTIGALFELAAKNNAAPMKELLGFNSEQEVKDAFLEEGADLSMAEMVADSLEDSGLDISDEDMADLTQTMTNMVNKISYTAEITSESSDTVEVTLQVKGYSFSDMYDVMMDAFTAMQDSITEEDMIAMQSGDEDVYNKYMNQYIKDFISGLGGLELNPDPVEIVVSCEKLAVESESGDKIAWLPSNMAKFSREVDNAIMQE